MPVDSWKIVVHNYTPFEREDLVFVTIPLERGTIVHGQHNQREFTVFDNRGAGTSDWVQYWPLRIETSDYPWMWRDGSLRLLRLCFPVRLQAGLPRQARQDGLEFDYYSAIECTVRLEEHPTGQTFIPDVVAINGLATNSIQLHFEGQVGNMSPLASPDHEGNLVPATEIQRVYKPPTGNENLAWVKTFITKSRTIPPDWRTAPSLWTEFFYQLRSASVASSRCVEGYLDFGPSRITEDDAPDINVTPNVRNIQNPVFWRITNGSAVAPDQKIFMPVWPGTDASERAGPGGSVELCAFDPDDYLNRVDLGSIPQSQARDWRAHMNEGSSFPNRVLLHYGALSALQDQTRLALSWHCGQPWAVFKDWHLSPWKEDFGPWGFVLPQERFHEDDDVAFRTACNHTNYIYRNRVIALDNEEDVSGSPGSGRARRDPHAAPVLGHHPDSAEGGGQQDFGFAKCWVHVSPKRANPDLRAWHCNALQYSGFPIERRERNGRRYIPSEYISDDPEFTPLGTMICWNLHGKPYYQLRPHWANYLGKPVEDPSNRFAETGVRQFSQSGSGRFNMVSATDAIWTGGLDAAHQSMNAVGHYVWLRGDPYILWRLESFKNHTLVSGNGVWRDTPEIAPLLGPYMPSDQRWRGLVTRTEGRYAQFHHYLHVFGGDDQLDKIIAERICDSLYPNRWGNPDVTTRFGHPVPTQIPDPIYLFSPLLGQPPGPAYQPFMMALKSGHLRALARAYAEDAERLGGPPRARELVDKCVEMADDIDDYLKTAGVTHNRPDPELATSSGRVWHRVNFVATLQELQPDGRGLPAPLQFGDRIPNELMSPVAGHRQDGYMFMTASDAFVFQLFVCLEMALFRGLGSETDRAIAAQIMQECVADAEEANFHVGHGRFADFGWGNGESERSSQYHTWFTDERGGFGPYTTDLPPVSYAFDTTGRSSSQISVTRIYLVTTGGKSASQINTRVVQSTTQINYTLATGGKSASAISTIVLAPIVVTVLTIGVSQSSIVTVIRGALAPTILGARLWSWHRAGQFAQHVTLATVGNPNAIDQVDDLSGNGRHLIGMNPDDFGNDRRAGLRTGGVAIGSSDGGPWSTPFPTIASERLPALLWFANAYRQAESLAAAGEFYLLLVATNTRVSGYRDMWGETVDDHLRLEQTSGGGRVSIAVAGGGQTWVTDSNAVPRGALGLEIWRDASDVIHVRANGTEIGNDAVVAGTFDISGFGYRNENASSTSYWDDYAFEIVIAKGATTSQERDDVLRYVAEVYALPSALAPQPIQYSFATQGRSASIVSVWVLSPISYGFATRGASQWSVTTRVTGTSTLFYSLITGGNSRSEILARLQPPPIDYSLETGGKSASLVQTIIGTRGVELATRFQILAYEHFCNPRRFGTEFTYVRKDGTRLKARGLVDWDDVIRDSVGHRIRGLRIHIARHPKSVMDIEPGVEFVELPMEPGGEVVRARVMDAEHEDEAWFTVEVHA